MHLAQHEWPEEIHLRQRWNVYRNLGIYACMGIWWKSFHDAWRHVMYVPPIAPFSHVPKHWHAYKPSLPNILSTVFSCCVCLNFLWFAHPALFSAACMIGMCEFYPKMCKFWWPCTYTYTHLSRNTHTCTHTHTDKSMYLYRQAYSHIYILAFQDVMRRSAHWEATRTASL